MINIIRVLTLRCLPEQGASSTVFMKCCMRQTCYRINTISKTSEILYHNGVSRLYSKASWSTGVSIPTRQPTKWEMIKFFKVKLIHHLSFEHKVQFYRIYNVLFSSVLRLLRTLCVYTRVSTLGRGKLVILKLGNREWKHYVTIPRMIVRGPMVGVC